MTVVIGIKAGGSLAFCSDQQVAYGPQRELCERKWERVGDVMVGWSGRSLSQQWARERLPALETKRALGGQRLSADDALTLIATDWRKWMTERKAVDEDGDVPGRLLVGLAGHLWTVDGDGGCRRCNSAVAAIGTGASAAGAAAMALLASSESSAEHIAWMSVQFAVSMCADLYGVAKPEAIEVAR